MSVEDTWKWRRSQTGQGQEEEELGDIPVFISGHRKEKTIIKKNIFSETVYSCKICFASKCLFS